MAAFLVFTLMVVQQELFNCSTALPSSVKPSQVPAIFSGLVPRRVAVSEGYWVRGFHPLCWQYTIHGSYKAVHEGMLKDFPEDPSGSSFTRYLPDRIQGVTMFRGGGVETPKTWPSQGVSPRPPFPAPTPKLPSLGPLRTVNETSVVGAGGGIIVYVYWAIPFGEAEARKRIDRDIALGAPWEYDGFMYQPPRGTPSNWDFLQIERDWGQPAADKTPRWVVRACFVAEGVHWDVSNSRYVKDPAPNVKKP